MINDKRRKQDTKTKGSNRCIEHDYRGVNIHKAKSSSGKQSSLKGQNFVSNLEENKTAMVSNKESKFAFVLTKNGKRSD